MLFEKGKFFIFCLLAIGLSSSVITVSAEPLGFLVNKVMEKILENANKPESPQHALPSPNRRIPGDSTLGKLEPTTNGRNIIINGKPYQLAFSARIRDERGRIVQTSMIAREKRIRYTLNNQNEVDKIWLLAPAEK